MRQRILRLAVLFALAFAMAEGTGPATARSDTAPLKRIGYLTRSGCPLPSDGPIRHRLAELGWIEGRNLAFECVSAKGRLDQVPALAAELVSRRPDVLMADANSFVRALKQATATIPIIMILAQDPVRTELVTNLARPEANVTGVAWFGYDLLPKRIELLKEIVPKLERLAIIVYAFADPKTIESLQDNTTTATKTSGFTWQLFRPEAAEDYDKIFAQLSVEHFDAAYVHPDALSVDNIARICELALRYRMPSIGEWSGSARAGLLLTYGQDSSRELMRVAEYIDKILRGVKVDELPVEQPIKFELAINLKTAKALGLTIPESFLLRADEVIE